MKYMLLILGDSAVMSSPVDQSSPEFQAENAKWGEVTQRMAEAGVLVAGDPLQGTDTATTVRGEEQIITDGPFAETKEVLIGYYVLDVPDLDAALKWARELPNLSYGSVEVRPIMQVPVA
jgi:hypothetical protein